MRPNRLLIGLLNTLCLATLAACGGGGGGSTGANPVPTALGFGYVANTAEDTVSAFTVDSAGQIAEIDHQQVAGKKSLGVGNQPLSIVVEPSGKFAYVANRADDTVTAFAIDKATGKLQALGQSVAAGKYPSFLVVHPSGSYLYAVNFGIENGSIAESASITTYSIAGDGTLTPIGSPVATGSGPVSMSINRGGNLAYVANKGSDNVSAYTIDSTGAMQAIAGGLIASGDAPSSVVVDPSPTTAKFVYVTNQLGDSISGYMIDGAGVLSVIDLNGASAGTAIPAEDGPVAITFDPTGNFIFVANHESDNVSAFRVDGVSGALTEVVGSPFPAGDVPYFIDVDPTGAFVYVANQQSDNVSIFLVDKTTNPGALGLLGTVPVGIGPSSIVTIALPQ